MSKLVDFVISSSDNKAQQEHGSCCEHLSYLNPMEIELELD
ncbi:MAG: hypothetical protein ACFBSG_10475 [Leptolyngbyaceae cyanobacterium]